MKKYTISKVNQNLLCGNLQHDYVIRMRNKYDTFIDVRYPDLGCVLRDLEHGLIPVPKRKSERW